MNFGSVASQFSRIHFACGLPVNSLWREIRWCRISMSRSCVTGSRSTSARLQRSDGEIADSIQNVSDAAGHSRREVSASSSEHHHQAIGHVFAAVIADAFHNSRSAGIANRKSFAGHAAEESFAARRAIETNVADQNIFFRHEFRFSRRGK